ncbi:myosin heavy chain, embryonic smooth muscle isoform-like [Gymnodraco acuticeps]|uniref:Myosin heavy chain, embryonic smooth muscle isoform-like n=1 Tax=Gymnodraco acuticeps TaxID=8218 RepID=A0A6P8T741_GYMAC|nr:myosin heavy chain, embryonic smooth muscle isoform-like [Gymnodraco acuticeps]
MEKFSKMGVMQESSDEEEDGACGWSKDMSREFMSAREARERLRESAVKMARDAGMSPSSAAFRAISKLDVNNNGGAHQPAAAAAAGSVKTPKYSGKADGEAFHAQFELLAHAGGWSIETKALQLALCLTDEALSCLLLLSLEDRHSYEALAGALKRRFGQCFPPELLRNELSNRCRKSGETLRALANDVESLTRRVYAHMPPGVQSELVRDQFIRALLPADLRVGVQLQHLQSLQAALEMAVEREIVWSVAARSNGGPVPPAVRSCRVEEKPVWVTEMTESVQVSLEEKMREMEAAVNAERELRQQQEARLKAELASLERDLQESKEKESLVASLEKCLQEGKERERSLVEEGAKREAQYKELLRSLEAEKDNLEWRLTNQLSQLNGSIADYQQEAADNREHLAELQREEERLARERAELEAEAQSESDRAARLEEDMRQAQRERAEAESGKQEELLREKQLVVRQLQRQTLKTQEDLKRTEAELDTCKSQLDEAKKQASVAIAERSTMEQNAQHREASMKAEAEQTLDSVRFRLGGELKEMELRLDKVDRSGTMTLGQEGSISGPGSWSGSTAHNGRKAGAQNWTASGLVPAEHWRGWG